MCGPIIEQMNNHGLQQRQAENQQYMVAANDGGWLHKLWYGTDEKYHRPKGGFKSKEHKKNWKKQRDAFYRGNLGEGNAGGGLSKLEQMAAGDFQIDWSGMRKTAADVQRKLQAGERVNVKDKATHDAYFRHIERGTFGQNKLQHWRPSQFPQREGRLP